MHQGNDTEDHCLDKSVTFCTDPVRIIVPNICLKNNLYAFSNNSLSRVMGGRLQGSHKTIIYPRFFISLSALSLFYE